MRLVAIALVVGLGSAMAQPTLPQPPYRVHGRIVASKVERDGLVIDVAVGSRQRIDKTWTAHLADDQDSPVEHGDLVILRIDETRSRLRTRVARERLLVLHVIFEP